MSIQLDWKFPWKDIQLTCLLILCNDYHGPCKKLQGARFSFLVIKTRMKIKANFTQPLETYAYFQKSNPRIKCGGGALKQFSVIKCIFPISCSCLYVIKNYFQLRSLFFTAPGKVDLN